MKGAAKAKVMINQASSQDEVVCLLDKLEEDILK
jgi:hypothetical protein